MKTTSHSFLFLAVFTAGMTSLALEMSAERLLGNVFGTSNLVWANIIAQTLACPTLGYFLGGRWADRSPYPKTMYSIMAWGAFFSGLVPLASRPVLRLPAVRGDRVRPHRHGDRHALLAAA